MFKRLLYTTFGAGAGAAVCYPEEANEISADAYAEIRKKAMIAYNFVNGGKITKIDLNFWGDRNRFSENKCF